MRKRFLKRYGSLFTAVAMAVSMLCAIPSVSAEETQTHTKWVADFEDGSAVNDNEPAPSGWNYVESTADSSGTYVKDDSGNNWYRLYGYYWNSALLYRDINPDITSGKHKFSFKLKVNDGYATANNIIDVDFNTSRIWKIRGNGEIDASLDYWPGQNTKNTTALTAEDMKNGVTFTAIFDMDNHNAEYYANDKLIVRSADEQENSYNLTSIPQIRFNAYATDDGGDREFYIDDVVFESNPTEWNAETSLVAENQVQLKFDQPIKNYEALTKDNFSVKQAVTETSAEISAISATWDTVTLTLSEDVAAGTLYRVDMTNAKSVFGHTAESQYFNKQQPASKQFGTVWLSDFEDGSAENDNDPAPSGWNYVESTANSSGTYVKDDSDNTWYRLYGYYWNSALLYRDINPDITSGKHKFSFKLKVADNRAVENNIIDVDFNTATNSGQSNRIWKIRGNGEIDASVDYWPGQNTKNTTALTAEDMKNGVTFTAIFDMDNHNAEYYANDTLIVSSRVANDSDYTLSSIPQVRFNEYATGDGGYREFYIDDVKWETEMLVEPSFVKAVSFTDLADNTVAYSQNITAGVKSVELAFTDGVSGSVANPVTLTATDAAETNLLSDVAYNAGTGKVTANIASPLDATKTYTLKIAKEFLNSSSDYTLTITPDGTAYVSDIVVKKDGQPITTTAGLADGDKLTIDYKVVNPSGGDVTVIYGVYNGTDADGYVLKDVNMAYAKDALVSGTLTNVSVATAENSRIRVYVWDNTVNGKPILAVPVDISTPAAQ